VVLMWGCILSSCKGHRPPSASVKRGEMAIFLYEGVYYSLLWPLFPCKSGSYFLSVTRRSHLSRTRQPREWEPCSVQGTVHYTVVFLCVRHEKAYRREGATTCDQLYHLSEPLFHSTGEKVKQYIMVRETIKTSRGDILLRLLC